MKVEKATTINDVELIKPIVIEWQKTCNSDLFGIVTDLDRYFCGIADLILDEDSELFLLKTDEGKVVGYLGIEWFVSPLGCQKIASEHYWYVCEEHRGYGAKLLVGTAKDWAKEKGCSHFMMHASKLASDFHDKVCRFYETINMKLFETSYIMEVI